MGVVRTIAVTLKDGSTAVINASDFDPALHTVAGTKKKKEEIRRVPRKKFSSGRIT